MSNVHSRNANPTTRSAAGVGTKSEESAAFRGDRGQRSIRPRPGKCGGVLVLGLALAGCRLGTTSSSATAIATPEDEAHYRDLVQKLASDEMEGRGVTTAGIGLATELLEAEFRAAGLEPGGRDGSYRQCFDHPVSVRAREVRLEVDGRALEAESVAPAPFSASGEFEGPLVFGGYGIRAPDAGYDDYANLDARDRVLLLLRFEPRERDKESPLNGDRPSRHSDLRRKVFEARGQGARAVLLVAPPRPGEEPDRRVPTLARAEAESAVGIPVLHVLPAEADAWLKAAGTSLADVVAEIDREFASKPIELGSVRGKVEIERERKELCNVIGVVPGKGALGEEAVVIGAHFDHLGWGQTGTLEPGERAVHRGADDNASGTAGLVTLARWMGSGGLGGAHRTIVLAAFNGEEVGLAGSAHYVRSPVIPLDRTAGMLNLDMIGRLRERRVVVLGTESGDVWSDWLKEASRQLGLEVSGSGDGYGPSDQTSFYSRGVPVLHFFTGTHGDYHRPSDQPDKINFAGALRLLRLVESVAARAARTPQRVAYRESTTGPAMAGDTRGYGAWLGTIPDYTAMSPEAGGGVLLSGVRKGGPADAAGLRGGDRIVAMAGRDVDNLYDMTFVLRDHRPSEVIEVTVERDGRRLTLSAELGDRSTMESQGGSPHGKGGGSPHGHGTADAHDTDVKLDPKTLLYPGEERHLKNVRQLTKDGENAEAYWSPDGRSLVMQARGGDVPCDRIYTLDVRSGKKKQISSGKGRTTCAYYTYPKGEAILYASTHLAGPECPPPPDRSLGYTWAIYPSYDLFLTRPGQKKLKRLTETPGYDAEATVCPKDGRIVFTSVRDGDLELYLMDGKDPRRVTRLTNEPGYDGGAFFSPDCRRLVWRASRPTGDALDDYRTLLRQGLVRPSRMEIHVSDADGKGVRVITKNGAANFAPSFLPDSRRVIFASNMENPRGRNFDLFVIDPEAEDPESTIERITFGPEFDGFPMFSPDGKRVAFSSNRNAREEGDTNVFVADWVE